MRGGTSRALVFRREDLPADRADWDAIFLAAMGSPDPNGRQLDGMGGGISSLSKIAVVSKSTRADADVDYTFGQVAVDSANVGYKGNCGNISSAIGPYAVDEGMIETRGHEATVRIHNTNTGKIIHSTFPLEGSQAAVQGDFRLQGVAGSGAPIRLSFLDPAGAVTGKLFPGEGLHEKLRLPDGTLVDVSLVDAANPVVFARASAFGLSGSETATALAGDADLMTRLRALRVGSAVAMGVARDEEEARTRAANLPLVALVSADREADIRVQMISADQPHKAVPLTGALCLAVAAKVRGTVVHDCVRSSTPDLIVAHPSGTLNVSADVVDKGTESVVHASVVIRTARRLMDGRVYY